ncbi:DUF4338 domain-containing protein [Mucilaginibacter rigui]|uniref:DUF4338 domain-containing protein n=1 Tax=Mucilaginibacter rigui TaxID=534635 RepID=A0ABR7X735_9SPHI|nr:Druantia anti-phage system protein DruA [Mucilaginibacter rigui]MBD1385895.1 DUF4338 domain-containing protein [Mucilaginibacter rigui]
MTKIIEALTAKSRLKRKIRQHLKKLGFEKTHDGNLALPSSDKQIIRNLHSAQRIERIKANKAFIDENLSGLIQYFANGDEVVPELISPVLIRVRGNGWEAKLFRLASLTWSVPVSNGFGRRLRYLVWDRNNEKLIGLIAIGDPVFNLSVRDNFIGWTAKDRGQRLVNILDAYVLGAIPPYNLLLGGKLIASLLRTKELYDDFKSEYGNSKGIISGEEKGARLLAVTTSSSMGKSSVYNRIKLEGREYLKPIGYTKGWGHFHIPENIFSDMREYLRAIGHSYADLHQFGDGPNWRLRTARAALDALGFREDLLKHGVGREVFICPLAENAIEILRSGKGKPNIKSLLTVNEVAAQAVKRWVIPRAISRPEYKLWKVSSIKDLILNSPRPQMNGLSQVKLNAIRTA